MPRETKTSERTCIVTRQSGSPADMIRFVLDPGGFVVPDLKGRLPGRGVWVGAEKALVETAERRRMFSRGFKAEARIEPGLADRVAVLMRDAALGRLGLARKAGQVVTGFAKVSSALEAGGTVGLVHAREAAADGVAKLAAAVRRGGAEGLPVIRLFDGVELDLALGRPNVIHAALLAGGASESFLTRAEALAQYIGLEPSPEPAKAGSDRDGIEGRGADRRGRAAETIDDDHRSGQALARNVKTA